jgi:FKBP-type peptidyl-prolyl cis-trans isomerase FkpA
MINRSSIRSLCLSITAAACMAAAACGSSNPMSPVADVPFSTTDIQVGAGAEAATGNSVTVNYTGWLYDASKPDQKGAQFDSSIGRGPFTFTLGGRLVILGWDLGGAGLMVGGRRRLVIPPSLGYGPRANGPIPGNSTLVFDVELLDVK